MIQAIADFAPDNAEAGVGLALQDNDGHYLFFLAGTRHHCPPGELFYAGIGGHREEDEDWLTCVHREAKEEIGTTVEILSAPMTWYIPHQGSIQQLDEIRGIIALTTEQVIQGAERKPTLAELIDEGASIVASGEGLNRQVRLYPLGTAKALTHVLRNVI